MEAPGHRQAAAPVHRQVSHQHTDTELGSRAAGRGGDQAQFSLRRAGRGCLTCTCSQAPLSPQSVQPGPAGGPGLGAGGPASTSVS